jgi:hypothetical protein
MWRTIFYTVQVRGREPIDQTLTRPPSELAACQPGRIGERCSLLTGGMGYLAILIVGLVVLAMALSRKGVVI